MSINPLFRDHINFRDLGGYQAEDGRHIKYGLLYRSGGLYLMNQEEISTLLSLGIHSVMDLRTSAESMASPDPVLPGINTVRHSGLTFRGGDEIDFSPIGMSKIGKEGYEQLSLLKMYYSEIPFDNEALRLFMNHLQAGDVPIVFHCHTGKDRTGVFAMVLLLILGIPKDTVLKDFMLSNEFHRDTIEAALYENRERTVDHPELEELIRMRTGVTESIGESVISSIFTRYGSILKYAEAEFQIDEEKLNDLRNRYLE